MQVYDINICNSMSKHKEIGNNKKRENGGGGGGGIQANKYKKSK
jgi:hypothetical protein